MTGRSSFHLSRGDGSVRVISAAIRRPVTKRVRMRKLSVKGPELCTHPVESLRSAPQDASSADAHVGRNWTYFGHNLTLRLLTSNFDIHLMGSAYAYNDPSRRETQWRMNYRSKCLCSAVIHE